MSVSNIVYHIVYCAALNVKVICNTTGDRGTMDYIDVSQLHELLKNNTPQEVINSSDSRDMFVLFVLRYAIYAAPKEQLKKEMRNEVMKAGASEGDHLHKCHLDFLTSSDIAYAVWQYLNSHDDWERKLKDPTKAYNHDTKWSTDKTGASMIEGYKVYDALEKWCRELKGMSKRDASEEDKKCYEELRVAFNKKAKSLGLVRVRDVPKMSVSEEIGMVDAGEAVVGLYDFDELGVDGDVS